MSGGEDDTGDLPGGWEAVAAEYVLGLLPEAERAAFEERLNRDPDLRQDVAAWSEYFATFTDHIPEQAPPPDLIRRIEAEAWGESSHPFWRQLVPYFGGALAGVALAFVVFVSGVLEEERPLIMASLAPVAGDLAFAVQIDPPTHTVSVEYQAGALPEGRVLQLWLIPEGDSPISLGVMSPGGDLVVVLSDQMAARVPGGTLAVSDEPAGGSPTGQPTGDVQAAGIPIPI